jgi:hypothetical protein
MAQILYCWRCKKEVPMLDEHEWAQVHPHLYKGVERIKEYRRIHNASLHEAKDHVYGHGALDLYFKLTGYRETNIDALWHHRLASYGPPCPTCGKPFRTPRARFCAACGFSCDHDL